MRGLSFFAVIAWSACADVVCPEVADSCPSECYEIRGVPLTCEQGGPIACFDDGPGALTTDIGCVTRVEDGSVFRLGSGTHAHYLARTDSWRSCTEAEAAMTRDCPL